MARKRHSDEDILKLLREIELKLADGKGVQSACRSVGISDAKYYNWRKRFGGMGRSQSTEYLTRYVSKNGMDAGSSVSSPIFGQEMWETYRSALNVPKFLIR